MCDKIENVKIQECQDSKYLKVSRMTFTHNDKQRSWDYVEAHDSVAILVYDRDLDSVIVVKQFRPAVYLHQEMKEDAGYTYELCAGIMDKDVSIEQTAKEEVLEECGYDVPLTKLRKITSVYGGTGFSATKQYLFYCEVDNNMKVHEGGGIDEEVIQVIHIPVKKLKEVMFDENIAKPAGFVMAMYWFLEMKKN